MVMTANTLENAEGAQSVLEAHGYRADDSDAEVVDVYQRG